MRFLTAAILLMAIVSCATRPFTSQGNPTDAQLVTGIWKGVYTCAQGPTGLTLTLRGAADGLVEGDFLFYPTPSHPSAATGRFIVRGSYFSDGVLVLGGGAWIERPDNYLAVGLRGVVNGNAFTGVVPECGNSAFTLTRSG